MGSDNKTLHMKVESIKTEPIEIESEKTDVIKMDSVMDSIKMELKTENIKLELSSTHITNNKRRHSTIEAESKVKINIKSTEPDTKRLKTWESDLIPEDDSPKLTREKVLKERRDSKDSKEVKKRDDKKSRSRRDEQEQKLNNRTFDICETKQKRKGIENKSQQQNLHQEIKRRKEREKRKAKGKPKIRKKQKLMTKYNLEKSQMILKQICMLQIKDLTEKKIKKMKEKTRKKIKKMIKRRKREICFEKGKQIQRKEDMKKPEIEMIREMKFEIKNIRTEKIKLKKKIAATKVYLLVMIEIWKRTDQEKKNE